MAIEERMNELHAFTAFNATIKSAFDMALFDLSARAAGQPLYRFLGGKKKAIETDLTIGIDTPENMAAKAVRFKGDGVRMIKVKLGKNAREDVERIAKIRQAVGEEIILRVDANQGWSFDEAVHALGEMAIYNIQFCEQPMRHWDDDRLPALRRLVPIKIMADESVFDHHDARHLIAAWGCDYVNIKFAKSGGILEAQVALTAFAHFALAHDNIIFHDMDTCLLGHTADPVTGGVQYDGWFLNVPDTPGLGADAEESFLAKCEKVSV
jgi:L-Ala-D/L-Glu epimerase